MGCYASQKRQEVPDAFIPGEATSQPPQGKRPELPNAVKPGRCVSTAGVFGRGRALPNRRRPRSRLEVIRVPRRS